MTTRRIVLPTALAAASVLVLAGCASTPTTDDGRIAVVASTNVYGQIVEAIGGDLVDVTSIVSSASQDPHSFEPSARDQLAVSRAALVVENGGGYDAFVDTLIDASGTDAAVITAVELSHDWPENEGHDDEATEEADHDHDHEGHDHVEGFNEHVWYDPHTIEHVAEAIAEELSEISPDDAATFTANLDEFLAGIADLEAGLADLDAAHGGAEIFVTEPVPLYLTNAAGLVNVAPDAFTEAVEEGQDVPPATMLEALKLLRGGTVELVVVNAQTGGAETTAVTDEADGAAIPVVDFTETLPEGQTYLSWMQSNIEALGQALAP
ncbi:zinc ABC transporter substrate-binding protein [Microbacterium aoyamense]|uniref:Zinc ABC transporter substrate-binding protein n=1 Tax=Microbacterium aoyamense TaxID=344166 RepID=A0ABP5AVD2_9MICO|nr:zinc ABC transporter substrate-binding protein [Microbacterium aoyamense]